MNRERLLKLRKVLVDVHEKDQTQDHKHFDITAWVEGDREDGKATCGTVACAIGWYSLSEEGKADGWESNRFNLSPIWRDGKTSRTGFKAASQYFGISYIHAYEMFSSEGYGLRSNVTAMDVVAKIDELLNQKEPA